MVGRLSSFSGKLINIFLIFSLNIFVKKKQNRTNFVKTSYGQKKGQNKPYLY